MIRFDLSVKILLCNFSDKNHTEMTILGANLMDSDCRLSEPILHHYDNFGGSHVWSISVPNFPMELSRVYSTIVG